jgi:hypothetical protein
MNGGRPVFTFSWVWSGWQWDYHPAACESESPKGGDTYE